MLSNSDKGVKRFLTLMKKSEKEITQKINCYLWYSRDKNWAQIFAKATREREKGS